MSDSDKPADPPKPPQPDKDKNGILPLRVDHTSNQPSDVVKPLPGNSILPLRATDTGLKPSDKPNERPRT